MSQARLKILSDNIFETVTAANFTGEFTRNIERDRIFYKHEMKGEVTLYGDDFTAVDDLDNDCEKITAIVERFCAGEWVLYWTGQFTKFDTSRDYGGRDVPQCKMTVKVKTDDAYDCLELEWGDEINFFSASDIVTVGHLQGEYQLNEAYYNACGVDQINNPCDPDLLTVGCLDTLSPQVPQLDTTGFACSPSEYIWFCGYHFILGIGTPSTPPPYGTGWNYPAEAAYGPNAWWRCPDAFEVQVGILDFGRRFDDTIEYLIAQTACGLTVRSHFLGINATHAAPPSNIAYDYAADNYQDLTIHQKSDVKRPFGDKSLSKVWKMKIKDLLSDLQIMFNMFYIIEGNDLILEHVSYFDSVAGADYSGEKMALRLDYDSDVPKRELFNYSDAEVSPEFAGFPITYGCGTGDRERRLALFNNDVLFVNDVLNQDIISDSGWVLVANVISDDEYHIIDLNAPLGWSALHENLHKHYRPFIAGNMNDEDTTFLSVEPIQKQPPFSVGLCCDDEFDPTKYITTLLGQGRVKSSIENIKKDRLELALNY